MSTAAAHGNSRSGVLALAIAAVGVVFGDIGTSPLYTLKTAFSAEYGLPVTDGNVLGVLSLVFWSLLLVVSIKYVLIIMRADNRGEGGIVALMALAQRNLPLASEMSYLIGILGIFGAALFFGDGVITPAISVLSAVEGLQVAAPALSHAVRPVTVAVLLLLFVFQYKGTDKVGAIFGPVVLVWFIAIALLGLIQIIHTPRVLHAMEPIHAFNFLRNNGKHAFLALGAVVLAITGGEALYADMGHFGKRPIQLAWTWCVFPALILNYFGQGSLMLNDPAAAQNPFYLMVPDWLLYPMIVLATIATVVASQAVISGAFSLARQAVQLGYLPQLEIKHTSAESIGQVYVPWVNRILLLVVIALVLGFKTSDNLASAYGVSVTGTMLITTLIAIVVAANKWMIAPRALLLFAAVFLTIDLTYLCANLVKFREGGWFPLALGVALFTVMRTWRRGRQLILEEVRKASLRIEHFIGTLVAKPPIRVPGTAIFVTASSDYVPMALLHNLKHNGVLHEHNVLLTVQTITVPRAQDEERAVLTALGHGFYRLGLRYGFLEEPDVPRTLSELAQRGFAVDLNQATFFASRETVLASPHKGMAQWRDKLFGFMARNALGATSFFRIPGNRLVELGAQVEI